MNPTTAVMDFIRNRLPDCPLEARKFHCPATALNLDGEIAGAFWIYFCCRVMAQLFPGGLHFQVHLQIEMVNDNEPGADDDEDDHEDNEWEVDEADAERPNAAFRVEAEFAIQQPPAVEDVR